MKDIIRVFNYIISKHHSDSVNELLRQDLKVETTGDEQRTGSKINRQLGVAATNVG